MYLWTTRRRVKRERERFIVGIYWARTSASTWKTPGTIPITFSHLNRNDKRQPQNKYRMPAISIYSIRVVFSTDVPSQQSAHTLAYVVVTEKQKWFHSHKFIWMRPTTTNRKKKFTKKTQSSFMHSLRCVFFCQLFLCVQFSFCHRVVSHLFHFIFIFSSLLLNEMDEWLWLTGYGIPFARVLSLTLSDSVHTVYQLQRTICVHMKSHQTMKIAEQEFKMCAVWSVEGSEMRTI